MRPEDAVLARDLFGDPADRDDGGVRRDQRVALGHAVDRDEQLLLQRQLFRRRLEDDVGIGDRIAKIGAGAHAPDGAAVLVEIDEVPLDPLVQRREAGGDRVVDGDLVPGDGKNLRDAVPHQAGADDRDPVRRRHAQPAV